MFERLPSGSRFFNKLTCEAFVTISRFVKRVSVCYNKPTREACQRLLGSFVEEGQRTVLTETSYSKIKCKMVFINDGPGKNNFK